MGSGRKRSNIADTNIGGHVITSNGSGAIRCQIDQVLAAEVRLHSGSTESGSLELTEDSIGLVVSGELIAVIPRSDTTDRIATCMKRGHRFIGVVAGTASVRVWNDR
jgi:hypothetical protein